MIDDIMIAVLKEARAFLAGQTFQGNPFAGTILLETNYKSDQLASYAMPMLLIDIMDAQETSQYAGGVTRGDWVFGFNTYNYEPDGYIDDGAGYGPALLGIIDVIRQHFSLRQWTIPARATDEDPMAMADILVNYGFVFTLSGITRANKLDQEGLVMGWRIMLDSVAIDDETDFILLPGVPLAEVQQIGYPPTE